jgi:hypothetical protein
MKLNRQAPDQHKGRSQFDQAVDPESGQRQAVAATPEAIATTASTIIQASVTYSRRKACRINASSRGKERRLLVVGKQRRGSRYPARRLGPRPRKSCQRFNLHLGHRQLERLSPSGHDETPRSINPKQGIHQQIFRSMSGFMESVV